MTTAGSIDTGFAVARGEYLISTDPLRLDRQMIHHFLSTESYWARGIPYSVVDRSIDHSLNFGLYESGTQLGYARVITDRATFAFMRDVFVVAHARGRGLGAWIVATVVAHPDLQGLRRVMLATRDAHGLYEPFGFAPLGRPDRFLSIERSSKELYR
jgi:GNAT superfamily N-acetyltransferase